MRHRRDHIAAMVLISVISCASTDTRAQKAGCSSPLGFCEGLQSGCATGFAFCDGCDTFTTISVQTGQICTLPYQARGLLGAIFSQRVVARPRNGIYGTANQTFGAYKANSGFVGNDSFQVDIEYERSGKRFVTHLKATVNVHR